MRARKAPIGEREACRLRETDFKVQIVDERASKEKLKLGSEESVKSAFDTLKSRRTTGKLVFGASDEVWEDYLKTCKK